jgi:hypothetical protein
MHEAPDAIVPGSIRLSIRRWPKANDGGCPETRASAASGAILGVEGVLARAFSAGVSAAKRAAGGEA